MRTPPRIRDDRERGGFAGFHSFCGFHALRVHAFHTFHTFHAVRRILGLVVLGFAAGCGTIRLELPPGRSVRLLEVDEPAELRSERTVWFWLWGGQPISDNTAREDIETLGLTEVRVRTEQTMVDNIVTLFGSLVTITRRTLIVEGNVERAIRRKRTSEAVPAKAGAISDAGIGDGPNQVEAGLSRVGAGSSQVGVAHSQVAGAPSQVAGSPSSDGVGGGGER